MKKLISKILLVSIVALTACNSTKGLDISKLNKSIYDSSEQSTDVTLLVEEKNITTKTENITLIYTNLSEKEFMYGEEPLLEIEINGIWYVVPSLEDVPWHAIGYVLSPSDSREYIFSIKKYYSQLNEGNYRIVKTLNSKSGPIFVIANFEIK